MTQANSDTHLTEVVQRFVSQASLQQELSKADKDIPAFNRSMSKLMAAAEVLVVSEAGRALLEGLLASPAAFERLRAAQYVRRWAPQLALPVLGRLIVDRLDGELTAGQRLELRVSAKDSLFSHFNITTSDQNDLIEPLSGYGVDLPWIDHRIWQ